MYQWCAATEGGIKEQFETYKKQTRVFEQKYHKTYEEFLQDVPDTIEGHDDWIDWSYLTNVAADLSRKVDLLSENPSASQTHFRRCRRFP
ncbi:MAG: hypothetical protein AB7S77_10450 [Desulfatirhabdiaceae bacterium]